MIIASRPPAVAQDAANTSSNSPQQNNADRDNFNDVLATVGNGATPDRRPSKDANGRPGDTPSVKSASAPSETRSMPLGSVGLVDMLSRATATSVTTMADRVETATSGTSSTPKKAIEPVATSTATAGSPPAVSPGSPLDVMGATLSLAYAANASPGVNGPRDEARTKKGDDGASLAQDEGLTGSTLAGPLTNTAGVITISHIAVTTQIAPHAAIPGLPSPAVPTVATVPPQAGGKASASNPVEAKAEVESVAVQPAETASPTAAPAQPALPPVTTSVARAVIALAAADGAQAPASASDPAVATPAPARTLTLQLSPSNLGTVEIRLHVTGSTLDVDLTVSDPQTLGLISRDHDALAGALRDQNYDVASLVIQSAPAAEPSTNGDAQSRNSTAREDLPDDDRSKNGGNANSQDRSAASGRGRDDRPSRNGASEPGTGGSLFI